MQNIMLWCKFSFSNLIESGLGQEEKAGSVTESLVTGGDQGRWCGRLAVIGLSWEISVKH